MDSLVDLKTELEYKYYPAYSAHSFVLLHPSAMNKTKILFSSGNSQFTSKIGVLTGNHFLTLRRATTSSSNMANTSCGNVRKKLLLCGIGGDELPMYLNDPIVVVVSSTKQIFTQPDEEQRIPERHTQPTQASLAVGNTFEFQC